jgi:hypothetical protein
MLYAIGVIMGSNQHQALVKPNEILDMLAHSVSKERAKISLLELRLAALQPESFTGSTSNQKAKVEAIERLKEHMEGYSAQDLRYSLGYYMNFSEEIARKYKSIQEKPFQNSIDKILEAKGQEQLEKVIEEEFERIAQCLSEDATVLHLPGERNWLAPPKVKNYLKQQKANLMDKPEIYFHLLFFIIHDKLALTYWSNHPDKLEELNEGLLSAFIDSYDIVNHQIDDNGIDDSFDREYVNLYATVVSGRFPQPYRATIHYSIVEKARVQEFHESLKRQGGIPKDDSIPESFIDYHKQYAALSPEERQQLQAEIETSYQALASSTNQALGQISELPSGYPKAKLSSELIDTLIFQFTSKSDNKHSYLAKLFPLLDKALLANAVSDESQVRSLLVKLNFVPLQLALLNALGEDHLRAIKVPQVIIELAEQADEGLPTYINDYPTRDVSGHNLASWDRYSVRRDKTSAQGLLSNYINRREIPYKPYLEKVEAPKLEESRSSWSFGNWFSFMGRPGVKASAPASNKDGYNP